jgi:hypothetical protein
VALGNQSAAVGTCAIAIGDNANVNGAYSIGIGTTPTIGHDGCILIGSNLTSSADNALMIGSLITGDMTGATATASFTIDGTIKANKDMVAADAGAYYMGDPETDDSWRMVRSGNNLVMERRESGSWVVKQTITP